MSSTRASYRTLYRATREAFRGDARALAASREEVRGRFLEHAGESDPARLEELRRDAREAARFLEECVAQATENERGNYELRIRPGHVDRIAEEARPEGGKDP